MGFSTKPFFCAMALMGFAGVSLKAAELQDILPHLHQVYQDGFLEIRSNVGIPNASVLAARMKAAYEFDRNAQGFTSAPFDKPYVVGLASSPLAAKYGFESAGGGAALDGDTFVSHVVDYPTGKKGATNWDGGTLSTTAHEFEHSLLMRAGAVEMPVYICEGICCSLGDRYSHQTSEGDEFIEYMADLLAKCKRADAEDVIRHFRVDADFDHFKGDKLMLGEEVGGLFHEYMAARVVRDPAAYFRKWGTLSQKMGSGKSFKASFKKQFGITLAQAEKDFLKFVAETEGNPAERFKGMVWNGFGEGKKKAAKH